MELKLPWIEVPYLEAPLQSLTSTKFFDFGLVALADKFFCTFNRADLANLVNEAALLAGRASKLVVGKEEFSRAVERAIAVRLLRFSFGSCFSATS